MSNKIYKMNVAEGIFFAAFDRNICDDGQIRIDEGRMERIWDALAFYGGHGFTIHWKGEVELGAYDHFEGFLTLPAEAVMTVTGVVNGQEELLVPSARGDVNPVELKGKFSAHGQGAVLTDLYFKMESPNPVNVVLVRWLGLLCSKLEAQAEAEVPVWQDAWDQEISHDRVGNLEKNLRAVGADLLRPVKLGTGSTDVGNVSQVAPCAHPMVCVTQEPVGIHTVDFRDKTMESYAQGQMILCAKAMVLTGLDVLTDEKLRSSIREEFENK